jgi:hypothetical protein
VPTPANLRSRVRAQQALVWDAIDWRLREDNAGRLRRRIFT